VCHPTSSWPHIQTGSEKERFLWAADQNSIGASCLVAWDKVQTSRQQGGLDIKNPGVQSYCLLLKLVHRLHCSEGSSWAAWVHRHANIASLEGELAGPHWAALRELLPLYRAITTVQLGNGRNMSFWFDVCCEEDCLTERFPALLSHCK
jgi:hypothetical protein